MKAIIAGAGIGGLSGALALARVGIDVEIIERASALGEIGAGIQVSPNAVKVLRALGLNEPLEAIASMPQALELRIGRSGAKVFSIAMGEAAIERYGAPYLHVHRADLAALLRQGAAAAGARVRLGAALVSYTRDEARVRIGLDAGQILEADLLIGADGLGSAVRRHMLGVETPRFTGAIAWRLLAPASAAPNLPETATVWAGRGQHAVTYRIRKGELINFVGVIEGGGWREEGWDDKGEKAELLEAFAAWADPLPAIIAAGGEVRRWALYDRPPLPRWSDGRIVLLGDACHPIPPFQAQGAAMAIEDGLVLARCLAERGAEPEAALLRYEAMRKPRTTKMLASSRSNMALFHRSNRVTQAATYGSMRLADLMAPAFVRSRQDWIYGYDVTRSWPLVG